MRIRKILTTVSLASASVLTSAGMALADTGSGGGNSGGLLGLGQVLKLLGL